MGWFFKSEEDKQKENCAHRWVITENLHITNPGWQFENKTRVSRTCSRCLLSESHFVAGHIDHSHAVLIFGGEEK